MLSSVTKRGGGTGLGWVVVFFLVFVWGFFSGFTLLLLRFFFYSPL